MRRRNRFLLVVALAVIASIAGLYMSPGATPALAANPPSSTFTNLGLSATTLTADGSTQDTATLTVKDSTNTGIANASASITAPTGCNFTGNASTGTGSSTTNTISGTADGTGVFAAAFVCHASANQSNSPATASVGWGASSGSPTVTITGSTNFTLNPPPANAGKSIISASPTTVTADGTSTSTITVTAEDVSGDPIIGRTISLTANNPPSGLTITGSPQTTSSPSGQATFTVKSSTAGTPTFSAVDSLNNSTFATSGTVTFQAAGISTTNSTLTISNGSIPADNNTTTTITATVKDAANPPNLVGGATINLNITSAQNAGAITITPNPATTGSSGPSQGVATFTVKCGNLQAQTVTFTANATPSGTQIGNPVTLNCSSPSASATNSLASASPSSVTADNTPSVITVTLKDGSPSANLLPGKTVQVTAANSYPITFPNGNTATTNSSGVATITVESTTQGNATFIITDTTDNVTLQATPQVGFTAPLPTAANSSVTVTGSPAPSDNQTQITVNVALRDKANNPVGGKTVVLSAPPAGVTVTPASATSNATTGVASFTIKSNTAVNYSFTVTDQTDNIPIGNGTAVFNQAPANALLSTVVANPTSVPADNSTTTTITVHLRDNGGNDVNGLTVALAAISNGTGVTISPPSGPSTGGIVTFTATSTTIHQNPSPTTFQATVTQPDNTQTTINQTAQVQFTSAPAANATVTVDTTSVPASGCTTKTTGGTGCVTVTIVATDKGGQAAVGKTFSLTPTCSSGNCNGLSSTPAGLAPATDATGTAKVVIGDSTVETVSIVIADATDPSQPTYIPSNTINLSFTSDTNPNAVTQGTISATPANVSADGTSKATITAVVKDTNGTPVQGATGTLFGNPSNGLTISGGAASNANGVITWTVTSTQPNTVTFTAGVGSAFITTPPNGQSNVVNFQPASVIDPTKSSVVASPGTTNVNQSVTITVTLLKSDGTPAPAGQVVNLTLPSGVNYVTPSSSPQSSDANGHATFTITSATAGTYSIGATAGNPAVTLQPASVTFNSAACTGVNASTSTVTVANSAPADNTTPIGINVQLAGTSIANQPITLTTSGPSTFVGTPPTTTDGSGAAAFQIKSGTVGSGTVTVSVTSNNCVLNSHPTYTFTSTASPVDPTKSTVVVSPATQTTGNSISVSVTLKDSSGNLVTSGKTVTISTSPSGPTITGNPQTSNGSGVATFTITSATPYSGTVIAVGDGVTINQQPTISFNGPAGTASPANSSVSASPNPATVGQTVNITVTVKDSTGATLTGKVVTLSASPSGSNITTVNGTTNAQGQATFTMTSSTAQAYSVTATVTTDNVSLTPVTVTFNSVAVGPATSANSTIQASPSSVAADGTTTATVTVTLHDASNNPTPNKSVTVNTGGASVGGTLSGTTNSSGVAIFSVTSTTPQTVTFTATDTTDNVTVTNTGGGSNTVTFTPVNPSALSPTLSTATANPTSVPADGTTNSTISVNIKNGAGANQAGVFVSIFGTPGGSVLVDASQKTTDANGNTSFLVRSSTAVTVTFTLTATNGSSSITLSQHPVVTFGGSSTTTGGGGLGGTGVNGVSCTNSSISTNYSQIPANNSTPATITVVLRNTSNAGISGQTVTLTANPATGVTITPISGVTDASGSIAFSVKTSAQGSTVLTVTGSGCTQNLTLLFGSATSAPIAATAAPGVGGVNLLGVPSTGPALGKVVPYRLRVRTGPGLKYHILGLLKQGTIVVLVARNSRGSWFQIQINGGTAWVSAYYIRVQRLTFRHLPIIDNALIPPPSNDNNVQAPINVTATPTH